MKINLFILATSWILFTSTLFSNSIVNIYPVGIASDICTGFAQTVSCTPESSPTIGKLNWNNNYLIVEVTATIKDGRKVVLPPKHGAKEVAGGLFNGDSLEFFIQPEINKPAYYHFACGPSKLTYSAKGRNSFWKNNAKTTVVKTKDYWQVTWQIPWSNLKVKPKNNMKLRFNIGRNYRINNKVNSFSFSLMETPSFHNVDTWTLAVLKSTASKSTIHQTVKQRKNLLENPEFNIVKNNKVVGWNIRKGAQRVENMALSNEWIIRCSGPAYGALDTVPKLEANKDYTLHVKARKVGASTMMGIILLWKRDDGKVIEKSIAWKVPLSDDYREYRYSFKAPKNILRLIFYRLNPAKDKTDAVDYASIFLYEGKSDPFEVRPFAFFKTGSKRPVKGTGPIRPNNPYGKSQKHLKVLALCRSLRFTYDVVELMKGLNVQCDRLAVTGTHWDYTPDIYYSDSDNRQVVRNILNNKYDLYIVSESTALRIGPQLQKVLAFNVASGKGIWFNNLAPQVNFNLKKAGTGLSTYKKGQVLRTASGEEFEFTTPKVVCQTERLNRLASLASKLYKLTGQKQLIKDFAIDGKLNTLTFNSLGQHDYLCTIKNTKDETILTFKGKAKNGKNIVKFAPLVCSGKYFASLHFIDKVQNTLDYSNTSFDVNGVAIKITPEKKSFTGRQFAKFFISLSNIKSNYTLTWEICDWTGRILDSAKIAAKSKQDLLIPIDAIQTNYAELKLAVKEKNTTLAFAKYPFVCRDRDRKRQTSDFTLTNWDASFPTRNYASQMEAIGMDNGIRIGSGVMEKFAVGISSGGKDRAWPHMGPRIKPENGVRVPSLADPVLWNKIEKTIRRYDKEEYHYGLTFAGIVDEAGLSSRMWKIDTEEVDCHPLNVAAYRKAMAKEFKTISNFNKVCGTNYSSFEDLKPIFTTQARSRKNFAEFILWRNFNTDTWISKIRRIRTIMDETDKDYPLCLYNSFGPRALDGTDYWKLLTQTGLGFSLEYTSLVRPGRDMPLYDFDEVYRSFRPDMRVWGFVGYVWSDLLANFQPWWLALHRYGGLGYFSMTACDAGTLLTLPDGELTLEAEALRKGVMESNLLAGFGKLFLDYQWAPRDIAVLWSHPSLMVSWCLGTEQGNDVLDKNSSYAKWQYARHNIRYLLEDLLYQYDFIPHEKLGQLKDKKLLILPYSVALSNSDIKNITSFLANGGKIIADFMPGMYSEIGVPRKTNPFQKLKNNPNFIVLNKQFNQHDAAFRTLLYNTLKQVKVNPIVSSPQVPKYVGREAMHFVDNNMHIFAIIRNPDRATDKITQTFHFPITGHLYDLRNGKYLGENNKVNYQLLPSCTAVFGIYPYIVKDLKLTMPNKVLGGKDLVCDIKVIPSKGKAGRHLFHVEVVPPNGKIRRRIHTSNLSAPNGQAKLVFRMAKNDMPGTWKLKVKDIMSGKVVEQQFKLTMEN